MYVTNRFIQLQQFLLIAFCVIRCNESVSQRSCTFGVQTHFTLLLCLELLERPHQLHYHWTCISSCLSTHSMLK